MKRIFLLFFALASVPLMFMACQDKENINPEDGYDLVTNANPIETNQEIVGKNFVISGYQESNAPQADTLYNGLNVAFGNAGQVFMSGGAFSSTGIWRLEDGRLSISGLGSIRGVPNGLNNVANDENPDGGWDTNKLDGNKLELFDNEVRRKFILDEL